MLGCTISLSQLAGVSMLAAGSTALTAYIICLIVGGGLLAISTLFGGHSDVETDVSLDMHADADFDVHADTDFDMHADADADVDTDLHPDIDGAHAHEGMLTLSSWFSIRFLVYFTATFGFVGTVLTYMTDLTPVTVLIVSVVAGLLAGQAVHQLVRALKRSSGDGSTRITDYVNKPARVTIAIQPPRRGEVAVHIGDGERFVAAASRRAEDKFDVGANVVVVEYANGTAEVVSKEEYEFTQSA